MTTELNTLLEELEVYTQETDEVNLLAIGGVDGWDGIEVVQVTKNSSFIVRINTYERHGDSQISYYVFEDETELIDWLYTNFR